MAPTDVSALGEFEQVVLLSILRLGDDAYAVSVRDEIARCTGREVSRGSIYITLDRLETKGYLKSRLADPTPERGGRAKRYYALRPRAIEALQGQPPRAGRAVARPGRRAGARMTPRLPLALRLFARFVPGDLREPIAGDLTEEYLEMRDRRGAARATLWLWGQAARLAWTFRWERATRGRALPPIGEELRSTSYMWDALRQDVGFGFRMLRRQPGFTTVAIFALALGIGANTAIFSVVDAVLWRPLPYPAADRVMSIAEQRPRESRWFGPVAPADYFDWRRDNQSFASMAAATLNSASGAYNLTGAGEPERVTPLEVSPAFLGVIGVTPAFGRDFLPEEETVGRNRVVLLSDGLWRRRFGARSIGGRPHGLVQRQRVRDHRRAAGAFLVAVAP